MGAHCFAVPFLKLQAFSGTFWVLPIDYNLYERNDAGSLVYLFISKVTTTKVNFCLHKQYSQEATCLICEQVIFA